MNDAPRRDASRARMQQIRCDIDQDLENMADSARNIVDWKHYVRTYPWVCLGTAAALGFLIVPKRSTAVRPDLATLTQLAGSGHLVVKPQPAILRTLVNAIVTTGANIAIRQGVARVGQRVQTLLETAADDATPRAAGDGRDRGGR